MDDLNVLLLRISGKLSTLDLSNMKFLCQDIIPKKKMEAIIDGKDLFLKLMELAMISKDDLSYLIKLSQQIQRNDLAEEVKEFQAPLSREETYVDEEPEDDQLDRAFDITCENVGRDWKMLVRSLGIKDSTIDQVVCANPYNLREQIRQCLREWKKKKREDANVPALLKALEKCRLRLVKEKIIEELNLSDSMS